LQMAVNFCVHRGKEHLKLLHLEMYRLSKPHVFHHRYRPPGSPGSGTIPKWISPGSASYVARPATSFIVVYITTVDPYVVIDLFYLFYF